MEGLIFRILRYLLSKGNDFCFGKYFKIQISEHLTVKLPNTPNWHLAKAKNHTNLIVSLLLQIGYIVY